MRLISITVAVLLVLSCTTGDLVKDLELGMSREQVISILGKPDGVRRQGKYEALTYANRVPTMWGSYYDRADYTVILEDGVVTEYGPGEVRNNGPDMLILVPLSR